MQIFFKFLIGDEKINFGNDFKKCFFKIKVFHCFVLNRKTTFFWILIRKNFKQKMDFGTINWYHIVGIRQNL